MLQKIIDVLDSYGIKDDYYWNFSSLESPAEEILKLLDDAISGDKLHKQEIRDLIASITPKIKYQIAREAWDEYEDNHVGRVGIGSLTFMDWLSQQEE